MPNPKGTLRANPNSLISFVMFTKFMHFISFSLTQQWPFIQSGFLTSPRDKGGIYIQWLLLSQTIQLRHFMPFNLFLLAHQWLFSFNVVSQEFRLQGAMSLHPTSACFPAGTELIEFEFRTDFPNLIESQEAVGFNYIQVMSSRPGRFVINTVVIAKPFDKMS